MSHARFVKSPAYCYKFIMDLLKWQTEKSFFVVFVEKLMNKWRMHILTPTEQPVDIFYNAMHVNDNI